MTATGLTKTRVPWLRPLTRNSWTLGVWLLLAALLFTYANLIPRFGTFQITSISKNSLPLIYLAIGQAVIVIAGGIDLSVGALLLLSNVIAARFMEGQPFAIVLLIALSIIVFLALLNALTGYIVSISGVPDIVVTSPTVQTVFGLETHIIADPITGTPMCVPIARRHQSNHRKIAVSVNGHVREGERVVY